MKELNEDLWLSVDQGDYENASILAMRYAELACERDADAAQMYTSFARTLAILATSKGDEK